MQIQTRSVMNNRPVCLPRTTSLVSAAQALIDNDTHQLHIVDSENRLLGVVTDLELLQAQMGTTAGGDSVEDYMSCEATTVSPKLPVAQLAAILQDRDRHTAVVVEDDQVVGHVHRRSIVHLISMLEAVESDDTAHVDQSRPNKMPSAAVRRPRFLQQRQRVRV